MRFCCMSKFKICLTVGAKGACSVKAAAGWHVVAASRGHGRCCQRTMSSAAAPSASFGKAAAALAATTAAAAPERAAAPAFANTATTATAAAAGNAGGARLLRAAPQRDGGDPPGMAPIWSSCSTRGAPLSARCSARRRLLALEALRTCGGQIAGMSARGDTGVGGCGSRATALGAKETGCARARDPKPSPSHAATH